MCCLQWEEKGERSEGVDKHNESDQHGGGGKKSERMKMKEMEMER